MERCLSLSKNVPNDKLISSSSSTELNSFFLSKSRSYIHGHLNTVSTRNPLDMKVTIYANEIRSRLKSGLTLTQIPFISDKETLSLLLYSFNKQNRNQNDILLIEHYLITFPNLMKTIYQKKYLYDASELLHKIAIYLKCVQIKKNTLICRLGEIGDKFYLIFQGSVAILIPREIKYKLTQDEYEAHLIKLFNLKEFELIMRTISSNSHIYMNSEIYQLKSQLENDINLYQSTFYREKISIDDYILRLTPETKIDQSDTTSTYPYVALWTYYHVTNINQGQTFGDIALSDDAKRRTATIISLEQTYCGTLDITVYKNCIKDAQEKIRKMNINVLLSNKIFYGFNLDIFDKRYFNYFKHISLKRNEELFKQCTLRKDIFFIKEGEIELYFKGCFKDINKILTQKGVKIDIAKEIQMTKTHPRYKEFYFEKRIEFKLFHCGSKEAIGLDEIVFDNELLYCCGKCSSDKAELFAIELKLFNEIIMNENRKKKVQEYITQRTDMMVKRLLHIKNITMKGMFHMFVDETIKNSFNDVDAVGDSNDTMLEKDTLRYEVDVKCKEKEMNVRLCRFNGMKRGYSMSNVVSACKKKKIIERNSSWNNMMIHNKKTFKGNLNDKSDISNNNNNRRNSVEHNKINLNTSVNSFLDNTPYHIKKTKTYEEPIFSIASVITYKSNNGVPLLAIEKKRTQKNNATVNVNTTTNNNYDDEITTSTIPNEVYRDIIDRALKKASLHKSKSTYTHSSSLSLSNSNIDFLAIDRVVESTLIKNKLKQQSPKHNKSFIHTNTTNTTKHSNKHELNYHTRQLTMETIGKRKVIKYIKPPIPKHKHKHLPSLTLPLPVV